MRVGVHKGPVLIVEEEPSIRGVHGNSVPFVVVTASRRIEEAAVQVGVVYNHDPIACDA